ncbi:hypothetical protein POM88_031701 [Heracleum sosnowskyi]|uniref:Uncharacterized protein n=1 Tax=Heracleum sosnowskyi TaxID=360622 RepID=A0AAD8I010_9APIA|nr:hypothetical protein POM88_031701 [Heracleum sosnowskyi]
MASSRIARFATEVAPPQIMSVMRNRTSKILDTINEDDREISVNDSRTVIPTSSSPGSSSAASPYKKIPSCLTKKFQRAFTLFEARDMMFGWSFDLLSRDFNTTTGFLFSELLEVKTPKELLFEDSAKCGHDSASQWLSELYGNFPSTKCITNSKEDHDNENSCNSRSHLRIPVKRLN